MTDNCITSSSQNKDEATFIIKYDDKSYTEMHKDFCLDAVITERRFNSSPEILTFLNNHPECANMSINQICLKAGGVDLLKRIICFEHTRAEMDTRMEAILNKHTFIYPELFPISSTS